MCLKCLKDDAVSVLCLFPPAIWNGVWNNLFMETWKGNKHYRHDFLEYYQNRQDPGSFHSDAELASQIYQALWQPHI